VVQGRLCLLCISNKLGGIWILGYLFVILVIDTLDNFGKFIYTLYEEVVQVNVC
jgi:hypothetical protein